MINLPWFNSRFMLSIYIGVKSASAVLLKQNNKGNYPTKQKKLDYLSSLDTKDNYQSLHTALESLLEHFDEELGSDFIPIQIALGDSLVSSAVFELDKIPAKHSMKNELLAMRFQKDCHIDMQNTVIASQIIVKNKQQALYAITAPDALISLIQSTIKNQEYNLHCIDKAIHYVFNHFYNMLMTDAALLFNNDEYWTLIIWDSDKNVVYFRSKLHSTHDEFTVIENDVLRLLHTYQQHDQQQIKQLYIVDARHDKQGRNKIVSSLEDFVITPLSRSNENKELELPDNDLALFVAEQR